MDERKGVFIMATSERIHERIEERRRRIRVLVRRPASEIEQAVLPTVTDIYSHGNFNRKNEGRVADAASDRRG
jgi:hypothetical protein